MTRRTRPWTLRGGIVAAAATLLCAAAPVPVHAESLRCSGGTAEEGDSRLAVSHKCGEPLAKDSHCAPVYDLRTGRTVTEPYVSGVLPCQQIDEWLYDRGHGNLLATVRFRSGVVQSITYGRTPR